MKKGLRSATNEVAADHALSAENKKALMKYIKFAEKAETYAALEAFRQLPRVAQIACSDIAELLAAKKNGNGFSWKPVPSDRGVYKVAYVSESHPRSAEVPKGTPAKNVRILKVMKKAADPFTTCEIGSVYFAFYEELK